MASHPYHDNEAGVWRCSCMRCEGYRAGARRAEELLRRLVAAAGKVIDGCDCIFDETGVTKREAHAVLAVARAHLEAAQRARGEEE